MLFNRLWDILGLLKPELQQPETRDVKPCQDPKSLPSNLLFAALLGLRHPILRK